MPSTKSAIKNKNRILEIGPGNGSHLDLIFKQAHGLRYFGLEISDTMLDDAEIINQEFIRKRHAAFEKYDGVTIPYVKKFFDRVLTVNTIYFWKNPSAFLDEICRVLKPNGICVITFIDGAFMQDLPFIDSSFKLFDINTFAQLVSQHHFKSFDIQTREERAKDKTGNFVDRPFLVVTLQKREELVVEED